MIANFQEPWVLDIHPRFNMHSFANFGAKKPEQKYFNTAGRIERIHEKEDIGKIPKSSLQPGGFGRVPGVIVAREVSSGHFQLLQWQID